MFWKLTCLCVGVAGSVTCAFPSLRNTPLIYAASLCCGAIVGLGIISEERDW